MFNETVFISSQTIKPAIDASCKVNGFLCNLYYKRNIEGLTQITGRGNLGTNDGSFYDNPDFIKVPLLIAEQTKVGYKGASKKSNPQGIQSIDTLPSAESPQMHIVTYEKQHCIDWQPMMKVEVFYTKNTDYPNAVYQTTEVKEMALPHNNFMHSGIIHVYLVPFM